MDASPLEPMPPTSERESPGEITMATTTLSVGVHISMLCVCGPLLTLGASQSGTGTGTNSDRSDVILSQMVYGELVIFTSR